MIVNNFELLPNIKSLVERRWQATKSLARLIFDHSPIGATPLHYVNHHERCDDLIEGKYPFEQEEAGGEALERMITREDNPEIFDRLSDYFHNND